MSTPKSSTVDDEFGLGEIIVSPISKDDTKPSAIDYEEQQERFRHHQQMMWDDAKSNPTKVSGGFFGFVRNFKRVEFHRITDIKSPHNRLVSWSDNVGQSDRNVLTLSNRFYTMLWEEWIGLGCPKKIQGTTRVVGAHERLSRFLKQNWEDRGLSLPLRRVYRYGSSLPNDMRVSGSSHGHVSMVFSGIPSSARSHIIGKNGAIRKSYMQNGPYSQHWRPPRSLCNKRTRLPLYYYDINADIDNPNTSTIDIVGWPREVLQAQSMIMSHVEQVVGIVKGSKITWNMLHPNHFKMTMM